MSDPAIRAARSEVNRCRQAVDRGGDPGFWIRRLERAAAGFEEAARVLRAQAACLGARRRWVAYVDHRHAGHQVGAAGRRFDAERWRRPTATDTVFFGTPSEP